MLNDLAEATRRWTEKKKLISKFPVGSGAVTARRWPQSFQRFVILAAQ